MDLGRFGHALDLVSLDLERDPIRTVRALDAQHRPVARPTGDTPVAPIVIRVAGGEAYFSGENVAPVNAPNENPGPHRELT
jgi:hypothetical protein